VGDDGIVAMLRPDLGSDDVDPAEEAVRACPTQALDLVD
jgi:ferredoxin